MAAAVSQRELDRKVQEVKLKIGKGIDVSAERDTFGEWAERWLRKKKERFPREDIRHMQLG